MPSTFLKIMPCIWFDDQAEPAATLYLRAFYQERFTASLRLDWLKDCFGLSWQIAPKGIDQWMASTNRAAHGRAFKAMLQMKKLDIAQLRRTFEGK